MHIDVVSVYDDSAKRWPSEVRKDSVVDNKIEFSDLGIVLSSFLLQAANFTHHLPPPYRTSGFSECAPGTTSFLSARKSDASCPLELRGSLR